MTLLSQAQIVIPKPCTPACSRMQPTTLTQPENVPGEGNGYLHKTLHEGDRARTTDFNGNLRQRSRCRSLDDLATLRRVEDGSMSRADQQFCFWIIVHKNTGMRTTLFIGNETSIGQVNEQALSMIWHAGINKCRSRVNSLPSLPNSTWWECISCGSLGC